MKIRTCFVSNSSSSSFIVPHIIASTFDMPQLTDDQIKLLEDFGFYKTSAVHPEHIEYDEEGSDKYDEEFYNYGYSVVCNEGDVLDFLVSHKIPFHALCHYGDYSVMLRHGSDEVIVSQNYGRQLSLYVKDKAFENDLEHLNGKNHIKKIKIEDWSKYSQY